MKRSGSAIERVLEFELSRGNVIVSRMPHPIYSADLIRMKSSISRELVEADRELMKGLKWRSLSNIAGFDDERTHEAIRGPAVPAMEDVPRLRSLLSVNLLPILALELVLGNIIKEANEPGETACPLLIVFESPLHKGDIDHQVRPPPAIQFGESRDPHYAKRSWYKCLDSSHVIAGPLV